MTTPPWQESWEFYEAAAEKGRAFVSIDLGAADHVPLASHSVRLQFRVKMLKPREDGLRSDEESEALFALEDGLVEELKAKHDALYVARATAYGYSEFFFYAPASRRDAAAAVKAVNQKFKPYQVEWFDEDDSEWATYFELFPNKYALQTVANRSLIRQMLESGDRLEVPRVVDHLAFFPSREQAEAAGKALVAADFQVDAPEPPNEEQKLWGLQFHREDACDGETPDEFCFEILDLLEPHEGEYDGWGSPIQRAADA